MRRMMLPAMLMATMCGCGEGKVDHAPAQKREAVPKGPTREDRQAVLDGMLANANLPLERAQTYAAAHGLKISPRMVDARRRWDVAHPKRERLSGGAEFIQSPIQPAPDR